MIAAVAALVATCLTACGPRKVEVGTEPSTAAAEALSIRMSNNLSQPVNVYVVNGATEIFVRQVAAGATEDLPVRGVTSGTTVRLRATTVDGTNTYSKDDVVLTGTYRWQVP
jgi:hypothetical protein